MRLLITTQTVDLDHPALGFFHTWILEFAKHCEEVLVICLQEGRHELPANVKILSLGKEIGPSRLGYVWRLYRYMYAYRHEYDAVFVHMNPEYVVLGGFFWRQWNKKIALWYVHKSVTLWLRIAAVFANVICTASPESIRLQSKKIRAMGHGIDLELFAARGRTHSSALRVLSIGRVASSKGQLELLSALDVLFARGKEFSWTIVGAPATKEEISYEQNLKEEIGRRAFASRIEYRGPVAHSALPTFFENSEVLVNISTTGGYDKVVLEAILSGVPAISSSEPFRTLLAPYGLFMESIQPEAVADMLEACVEKDVAPLREIVERTHSLSSLVPRILQFLA